MPTAGSPAGAAGLRGNFFRKGSVMSRRRICIRLAAVVIAVCVVLPLLGCQGKAESQPPAVFPDIIASGKMQEKVNKRRKQRPGLTK